MAKFSPLFSARPPLTTTLALVSSGRSPPDGAHIIYSQITIVYSGGPQQRSVLANLPIRLRPTRKRQLLWKLPHLYALLPAMVYSQANNRNNELTLCRTRGCSDPGSGGSEICRADSHQLDIIVTLRTIVYRASHATQMPRPCHVHSGPALSTLRFRHR